MSTDLLARARARARDGDGDGDGEAFGVLVHPYRHELQVHCYRILGSLQDAEDALQDTLLAAWQGLRGFEARASLRTWLYRVAASRCLNALRTASRRPPAGWHLPEVDPPPPTRLGEVNWLEPCPDVLLDELADTAPGPDARYEATEAIALAFITALHLLPPRQGAALILRDVLGFHANEAADTLDTTQASVTSALKRARHPPATARHGATPTTPTARLRRRTTTRRPPRPRLRRMRCGRHRRSAHRRRVDHHAALAPAIPRAANWPPSSSPPCPSRKDADTGWSLPGPTASPPPAVDEPRTTIRANAQPVGSRCSVPDGSTMATIRPHAPAPSTPSTSPGASAIPSTSPARSSTSATPTTLLATPHTAREIWQQAVSILNDLNHPDAQEVRTRLDTLDVPALWYEDSRQYLTGGTKIHRIRQLSLDTRRSSRQRLRGGRQLNAYATRHPHLDGTAAAVVLVVRSG